MRLTTETIGNLVERLFPLGFAREGYFCIFHSPNEEYKRQKLLEVIVRGDLDIDMTLAGVDERHLYSFRENERSNEQYIENAIPNIPNKIKEKYLLPPYTPFDVFALASTVLMKSGAYHHFESDLITSDIENPENERNLGRIIRVTEGRRNSWENISNVWQSYPHVFPESTTRELVSQKDNKELLLEQGSQAEKKVAFDHIFLEFWIEIINHWDEPVHKMLKEEDKAPRWWDAIFSLMVLSDNASAGAGYIFDENDTEKVNAWPWLSTYIMNVGQQVRIDEDEALNYIVSISIANRSIVNVLPKSRTAPLGCTLRSLSLNLASLPGIGTIRGGWFWADRKKEKRVDIDPFNLVLIPYPYRVKSTNFSPLSEVAGAETRWGVFQIDAPYHEDSRLLEHIDAIIDEAADRVNEVHGIILPELSVTRYTVEKLIEKCESTARYRNIELLCLGMRQHPSKVVLPQERPLSSNGAHVVTFKDDPDQMSGKRVAQHRVFHEKHHRWRLTESQITHYSLSPALHPARIWWEDLRIVNRKLPFFVMRGSWTATALICEDLARNDPARDIVEAVGPNLVISLLLDGPQVPNRWSARYASVLAEDPGSSVLSMSSYGLISRSNEYMENEHGKKGSDAIALWRDDEGGLKEINLGVDENGKFNDAVVISLTEFPCVQHTMDGRVRSKNSISLRLTGQRQICVQYQNKNEFRKKWDA